MRCAIYIVVMYLTLLSCSKEPLISIHIPGPPETPVLLQPEDNSTGQSITPILRWSCWDLDDDPLNYDVYFGMSSPPALVSSAQITNEYVTDTLKYSTTYYWKIIATENEGYSASSAIRSFTTGAPIDETPPWTGNGLVRPRHIPPQTSLSFKFLDPVTLCSNQRNR